MTTLFASPGCYQCGGPNRDREGHFVYPEAPDFCCEQCFRKYNSELPSTVRHLVLEHPSPTELDVTRSLREAILEQVLIRDLDNNEIAKCLGLLPVGAEVLLNKKSWSLETCFRFADALGMRVYVAWGWEER